MRAWKAILFHWLEVKVMRKLLSANLTRLWKNKTFLIANLFVFLGSIGFNWLNYRTELKYADTVIYVETTLFNLFPLLNFVCGIFISLFLGTEFDENTIRNKIIVGHTRSKIYFANYLTCIAASLLLLAEMLLFSGIAGWILLGEFGMDWTQILFLILCCIFVTAVCSAIFVALTMNIHSKSGSVVASMVLMLALTFAASYIDSRLAESPMTYSNVTITMDGVQYGDLIDNPAYVGGTARTVMEFLYDLLPTGQAAQLSSMDIFNPVRFLFCDLAWILPTGAGMVIFDRKNIQ